MFLHVFLYCQEQEQEGAVSVLDFSQQRVVRDEDVMLRGGGVWVARDLHVESGCMIGVICVPS